MIVSAEKGVPDGADIYVAHDQGGVEAPYRNAPGYAQILRSYTELREVVRKVTDVLNTTH